MPLTEVKKEMKSVGLTEVRIDTADYFEAVLTKEVLAALSLKLEKIFGAAQYPSSKSLPDDIVAMTQKFGGVREGQTLYFTKENGLSKLAMLWPWQDGQHLTLKIAKK